MVSINKIPTSIYFSMFYTIFNYLIWILFIYFSGIYSKYYEIDIIPTWFWISSIIALINIITVPYGYFKRVKFLYHFNLISLIVIILFSIYQMFYDLYLIEYYIMFNFSIIGFTISSLTYVKDYFNNILNQDLNVQDESNFYEYKDYKLYFKNITLRGSGNKQTIYYFSKKNPKDGIPCSLPEGFKVEIIKKTGLPYLKRIK